MQLLQGFNLCLLEALATALTLLQCQFLSKFEQLNDPKEKDWKKNLKECRAKKCKPGEVKFWFYEVTKEQIDPSTMKRVPGTDIEKDWHVFSYQIDANGN